jgi:protein TonB
MFDDFHTSAKDQQSQQRFRGSMAFAFVIYGTSSAAIVAATATAREIAKEELTQVEFAAPPEPPPPPPPPPVAVTSTPQAARPKVKRPELKPPDKISDEKLKESDKALADSKDTGPVDGFLDGAVGGTGTAAYKPPPPPPAAPKLEPLVGAVASAANQQPKYSAKVRRQGIEGTVVVQFDVLENGTVTNPRILSGPTELQDLVLKAVLTWRFQPAHRGKTPVRSSMRKSIVFRLEDA